LLVLLVILAFNNYKNILNLLDDNKNISIVTENENIYKAIYLHQIQQ